MKSPQEKTVDAMCRVALDNGYALPKALMQAILRAVFISFDLQGSVVLDKGEVEEIKHGKVK